MKTGGQIQVGWLISRKDTWNEEKGETVGAFRGGGGEILRGEIIYFNHSILNILNK